MAGGYPEDWDRRREVVYRRDKYQCQNCGRRGSSRGNAELHAHHIVPKSKGGSHNPSNLVTLCQQCHSAVHGRPIGFNNTRSSRSSSTTSAGTTSNGSNPPKHNALVNTGILFVLITGGIAVFWLIDIAPLFALIVVLGLLLRLRA